MSVQRLPEVRSLFEILPKGADGGKEFARIVGLLLYAEARRTERNLTLFDDSAGDFNGLDSVETGGARRGRIGYQYKFYPSPLSPNHRGEIERDLEKALGRRRATKLKAWVIVTPTDLMETRRRGGGDVTWFSRLQDVGAKAGVRIEHWGHRKLLGLLLDTPNLLLRYYPELYPQGLQRREDYASTRIRYIEALRRTYRTVEFVGMSVYKPEATRGIPMDEIYIPLDIIPWRTEPSALTRQDPQTLVRPDVKAVLLGDPGSGKSTLLRFAALVGDDRDLQLRGGWKPDARLPILVTLRRYADELKRDLNTSLLSYIRRQIQADFSLPAATDEFFLYHLETAQALLLFDGMDELPDPSFKELVRNRVRSLGAAYPGNTIWITSRVVGYEEPFRFGTNEFGHYLVAPLTTPQIDRFVDDWYRIRIEDPAEKAANVRDLRRILADRRSQPIRELAENPLLLTIIALVHRIDAVLPDERVVLYQKCTETLLNTWHTWKQRDQVANRGRIERRNRRRIESMAFWMHERAGATGAAERSVAPYRDVLVFLRNHIEANEGLGPDAAEDEAETFLEFVRAKAGLLIEVGDGVYSFLHLTFQEYLSSSYLLAAAELRGAAGLWEMLAGHVDDPRWHEIIRLAVAGLKSDATQEFVIDKLVELGGSSSQSVQLLAGLLLDSVESMRSHEDMVVTLLVDHASSEQDADRLVASLSMLRAYRDRDQASVRRLRKHLKSKRSDRSLIGVALAEPVGASSSLPFPRRVRDVPAWRVADVGGEAHFDAVVLPLVLDSPASNLIAAFLMEVGATSALGTFVALLSSIGAGVTSGPFGDLGSNLLLMAEGDTSSWKAVLRHRRTRTRLASERVANEVEAIIAPFRDRDESPLGDALERTRSTLRSSQAGLLRSSRSGLMRDLIGMQSRSAASRTGLVRLLLSDVSDAASLKQPRDVSSAVWSMSDVQSVVIDFLTEAAGLKPRAQWREALRATVTTVIAKKPILSTADRATALVSSGKTRWTADQSYQAATLMLLDLWRRAHEIESASPAVEKLGAVASKRSHPALVLSTALLSGATGGAASSGSDILRTPGVDELMRAAGIAGINRRRARARVRSRASSVDVASEPRRN